MITDAQIVAEVDRVIGVLREKARSGDIADDGMDGAAGVSTTSDLIPGLPMFACYLWEAGEPREYTDEVDRRLTGAIRDEMLYAAREIAARREPLVTPAGPAPEGSTRPGGSGRQ